jgi:hypothetical protein
MPDAGDRIANSLGKPASDIFTKEKFGDVELYLEFLMPANSNSGVYLYVVSLNETVKRSIWIDGSGSKCSIRKTDN